MSRITWGVDGFGVRHYVCDYCEAYFGSGIDPSLMFHKCDKTKPRYHNRGKHENNKTTSHRNQSESHS